MVIMHFLPIVLMLVTISNQGKIERFDVFNEHFENKYELIVQGNESRLVTKTNGKTIEIFACGENPYFCQKLDYRVYFEGDEFGYKHVGVSGDDLIDLDTRSIIEVPESARSGSNIDDALIGISFSDIPASAIFCDYSYYFQKLPNDGFGDNIYGTCCLISMQILFDYYDAIFHEDVIASTYDVHRSRPYFSCFQFPSSPCSNGSSFHSYLVDLCNSLLNIDIEARGYLEWTGQNTLINYYTGTVRGLDYSNNTSEGNWADIFSGRQFQVVMDGIDDGRPVILNNLGHSMVAFAYDNDYVYLMSGYKNGKKFAKMDWDDFHGHIITNINSAYDLILECDHECTEGYFSTILDCYLCPMCDD